jgi:hypothetical protein
VGLPAGLTLVLARVARGRARRHRQTRCARLSSPRSLALARTTGTLRSALSRASRRSIVLTSLRAILADVGVPDIVGITDSWRLRSVCVRRGGCDAPMHMLIYALVEAPSQDAALSNATTVFDRLVGARAQSQAVFDYYTTFDDTSATVSGPARFGDLPVATRVDSEAGQALLERGWAATKQEFERHLERVREGLDQYSVEEIMRDEDLVRHACHQLGAYEGSTIFLYDEHATGIRHRDQLDRVLADTDDCWIVPADVHY